MKVPNPKLPSFPTTLAWHYYPQQLEWRTQESQVP